MLLRSGEDVEPELLDRVSSLGSGSRVIGVYRQRWAEPGGDLSVYLHGVGDPGNVGAVIRSAHALADGPVVLGPGCADPFARRRCGRAWGRSSPARRHERARRPDRHDGRPRRRRGAELGAGRWSSSRRWCCAWAPSARDCPPSCRTPPIWLSAIPLREGGPESLNVAMAATVGLYELANRISADA